MIDSNQQAEIVEARTFGTLHAKNYENLFRFLQAKGHQIAEGTRHIELLQLYG